MGEHTTKVRDVIINEFLQPSMREQGKFILKKLEDSAIRLDMADKQLLDFFDKKLTHTKKGMKNLLIDFSTWQASLQEHKRSLREMERRVENIETAQEDVDMEALEGKENISVADVISVIKNMKEEILRSTVTQTDISKMRDQINQMEKNNEKFIQKQKKEIQFFEDKDDLLKLPGTMREFQMELLRIDNRFLEEGEKFKYVEKRVKDIETANDKSDQLF